MVNHALINHYNRKGSFLSPWYLSLNINIMFCIFLPTGYIVGFVMLLSSYSFFAALVAFFYAGSKVTKFKAAKKQQIEHDYKEGLWLKDVIVCNAKLE